MSPVSEITRVFSHQKISETMMDFFPWAEASPTSHFICFFVLLCFVWVLTMHIKLIRVFVEGSWHQDLVAAVSLVGGQKMMGFLVGL